MAVQSTYTVQSDSGRPGVVARNCQWTVTDVGVSQVQTGGTVPQPGYAVYWNDVLNGWSVPANATEAKLALGVVASPGNEVQNNDNQVEYEDGDEMGIITSGHVWVKTQNVAEYGDIMEWDAGTKQFQKIVLAAPGTTVSAQSTFLGNLPEVLMVCVSPKPAKAGETVQLRIGGGTLK